VQQALEGSSWGTYQSEWVEQLEERLAGLHGVAHALTCGSGTFAVELALRALKVGPGDEVVLAGYDYGGNFLCVHAVGARPVLIDVAADSWNLDPERIEAALSPATRVLLVSHLHGGLVPMREVLELAARHGLKVIEDAAQAAGARVQGRPAGSWGDVGVLSFGGSKLLSAGRGGALLTPHADVRQRARTWMNRGNLLCPLSALQAAVLLPQLEQLAAHHQARLRRVHLLARCLAGVPGLRLFQNRLADSEPAYYKVGFQLDEREFGLGRGRLVAALRAEGVAFDEGFRGLHVGRSPSRFRRGGPLTEVDRAHAGAVVLHHPILLGSDGDVEEVAAALRKVQAHPWPEEVEVAAERQKPSHSPEEV
jgi:dTDP-4-amino-4,6-dideoxygalactose transaminase